MSLSHDRSRWSLARLYSAPVILAVIGLIGTVMTTSRELPTDTHAGKSIKFSHDFHTKDAGVACVDCHTSASGSTLSQDNLLAKKAACQTCHEEQLSTNCTYCHTSSDSTTYRALVTPAREITFSHKLHGEDQKIACGTCHKDLDSSRLPEGNAIPAMATCAACHNDVKATSRCETCHMNLAALRPLDHNRSDFVREHKYPARLADARCGTCHTQESCIDCHNGASLTQVDVPGRDLVSPRSPRLSAIDRGQSIALAKIHDLNYRFTHGVDVKGRKAECQTCHSEEQFCVTCHAAGGSVNQGRFKPVDHDELDFVTFGVGSGGGRHATRAKRDIESCASCHDSQGADPTCITCHTDPDGVKGTDPKTHPRGFMSDVEGEWHNDPGASCYTCHTDSNARVGGVRGLKFCGYCHK